LMTIGTLLCVTTWLQSAAGGYKGFLVTDYKEWGDHKSLQDM
jgi:hypothetical protein